MKHVGELTSLETLRLDGTAVTDAGLRHLHGLSRLRYVNLQGTAVTDDGIEKLRAAMPAVKINR